MKRPRLSRVLAFAVVLVLAGAAAIFATGSPQLVTGLIPNPVIVLPDADKATDEVFLISGAGGWGAAEQRAAEALRQEGTIVVGIDGPAYLAALEASGEADCLYLVSNIESLSQQLQRQLGNPDYIPPVIAGVGSGGALALAIAAQTPGDTVGGTVAVDPENGIALQTQLCTPAERQTVAGKAVYELTSGPLPNPVEVLFTPAAPADGRDHVTALKDTWPAIETAEASSAPLDALLTALKPDADPHGAGEGRLSTLPLAILDAVPKKDAMAIVLSGDGGWRDLDKVVAQNLQSAGIPTVGLDSLKYFWSQKTPAETAADLSAIMDLYRAKWGVDRVLLVGYSFGADVLPAAFQTLDPAHQGLVTQVSFLALSPNADFQISVSGWLGWATTGAPQTLDDLRKMDLRRVQCVYGHDETDSACPALAGTAAEVIETTGGHHFDGDYTMLAKRIEAGFDSRLKLGPP